MGGREPIILLSTQHTKPKTPKLRNGKATSKGVEPDTLGFRVQIEVVGETIRRGGWLGWGEVSRGRVGERVEVRCGQITLTNGGRLTLHGMSKEDRIGRSGHVGEIN